jgi:hypothetical protein
MIRFKQPYYQASATEIERVDKALALVNASFVAAAKLVDMTPQHFRNLVNSRATLKAKWWKKRGRPPVTPNFRIDPHNEWRTITSFSLFKAIESLPANQKHLFRDWLIKECRPREN